MDASQNYDPEFSPDGRAIYFTSSREPQGIYRVPSSGGTPEMAIPDGYSAKISPDGAPNCQGAPNTGIAAPVIESINRTGSQLILRGHLQAKQGSRYLIELFANGRTDSKEGETFVSDVVAATDPDGHATFSIVVDNSALANTAAPFTATATSSDGATSEFSLPVAAPIR